VESSGVRDFPDPYPKGGPCPWVRRSEGMRFSQPLPLPWPKVGRNRDGRISELLPFPWLGTGRSGDRKPLLTTLGQGRGRA